MCSVRIVKKVWISVLKMSQNIQNTEAHGRNLIFELSKYFGHKEFKSDLQRQATEAVLRSKNEHLFILQEPLYINYSKRYL